MKLEAVLILTNGNSDKCFSLIQSLPYKLKSEVLFIIINDGVNQLNFDCQKELRRFVYIDHRVWKKFRIKFSGVLPELSKKINIGTEYWNTPVARNVSQLVCHALNIKSCLFFDDDYILKKKHDFIKQLNLATLKSYPTIMLANGANDYSTYQRIYSSITSEVKGDRKFDGLGGCVLVPFLKTPFYFPNFYGEDLYWINSFHRVNTMKTGLFHASTKSTTTRLTQEEIDIACLTAFWEFSRSSYFDFKTLNRLLVYRTVKIRRLKEYLIKIGSSTNLIEYLNKSLDDFKNINHKWLHQKVIAELENQNQWNEFFTK